MAVEVELNFVEKGTPKCALITRNMQSVPREGDLIAMNDDEYGVVKEIFWQVSGVPIVKVLVSVTPDPK